MDISKIKVNPKPDGGAMVEMDDSTVERFKLFCLVDYYIGKSGQTWKLNKTESHPDGRVVLHVQIDSLTNKKK